MGEDVEADEPGETGERLVGDLMAFEKLGAGEDLGSECMCCRDDGVAGG